MTDHRENIEGKPNRIRDCNGEKDGVELTKREERIVNIIIGIIGYTAGILMLLVGMGLIPAP